MTTNGKVKPAILVAHPEQAIAAALGQMLQKHGYHALVATNATEAVRTSEQSTLALIITDAQLADVAGKRALDWIRTQPRHQSLPALVLSAVPHVRPDAGSLDIELSKPIDYGNVLSTVKDLLEYAPEDRDNATRVMGALTLDLVSFRLSGPAKDVILTPMEFRLLRTLAASPNVPQSSARLVQDLWPGHAVGGVELLRVHVRNLRRKLNTAAGMTTSYVRTVPKVGYIYTEDGRHSGS